MSPRRKDYCLVLIVDPDDAALCAMVRTSREAGYQTTGVATFEEAKRQIKLDRVDVLITQARLGPYNGIQLVLLGLVENPRLHALILSDRPDPVMERETVSIGAAFVVGPLLSDALLSIIKVFLVAPNGGIM